MSPGLRDPQTLLLCASGPYQTPHRAPEPVLLSRDPGSCASLGQSSAMPSVAEKRGVWLQRELQERPGLK